MPSIRLLGGALLALAVLTSPIPTAAAPPGNGRLQIIHLDVGQGDGTLLITPNGQSALFDEGPGGNGVLGVSVVNQIKALGVTHLDHHFVSHYHSDHIGNFTSVVNGGVALDYGWDRAGSYSTSTYTNYVSAVGTRRRTLTKGQVITLDSLSAHPVLIKCIDLAGAGVPTTDENSLSLVMKVSYGEFDEVIGGDLQGSTGGGGSDIESIVGPSVGQVEVYKVHHHGSRYSSNATWLSAIKPKIGVIECGNGNSYGHPTADALSRLHAAGVRTYWTETGAGVAPDPTWDKVANGQVIVSATWEAGGVDSIYSTGFVDLFTNNGGSADLVPPTVSLTSPVGGEHWSVGSVHNITWSATDNVAVTQIDLAFSSNGGTSFPTVIATNVPNTGSYAWTVPMTMSSAARVRVTARDAAGNLAADSSASSFTTYGWTVAVSAGANGTITPSGTPVYADGATPAFAITAASGYHVNDVLVNGVSVGAVTTYTFSALHANQTLSASFVANPADAVPPVVTLTAPAGGESWPIGSSQTITWTATDNIGVTGVDLAYSLDGGVTFPYAIASGLANTGSYPWTVPMLASSAARVRVRARDLSNNTGSDSSHVNVTFLGYLIAASAGTGGAISPSGNTIVAPGVNQAYAITPNAGYLVGSVLVDGVSVGTVTAYTFSNVSAGHTIAVTFAPTNPPSSYPMALGNYSEGFDDIANWADNFAAGVGASYWGSVPVTATGTIPDGVKTTASSATFLVNTSFSSSVQRGTGALWMLSTGTTDNSSAIAVDLRLDFTGVTAGTLSFDWAQINNSTGNRTGSVRVYTSTDGVTYTNLSSANVLNVANNTGATGRIASVALPSSFSNNANARLRFYYSNGSGGSSGSRPKIAIDNVAVTGTPIPVNYTITASAGAGGSITPSGAVSVTGGQNKSFAIAANVGSHIAGVQVDGVSVGAVSAYTFSNVTANHTIAASFAADAWTLDVGITGSGAVTRSPDLATYPSGTLVQLTASPEAGFAFAGWSGDTTAFVNPLPLAMRSNRTLLASFVDVAAPVVKVTSPNGGEVWAAGSLHAITWTASDNVGVDSVTVQVSTRGIGGPWTTVQSGAANSGSLAWTVPAQSTDSLVARVLAYDHALNVGSDVSDSLARVPSSTTAVGPGGPAVLRLARPWPNPSAGPATVEFSLPARGRATLEVLDVEGRRVTALEGQFEAGSHVWTWDGRHHGSNESHAGLYFVRLVTPWGKRMERLVRL